MAKYFHVSNGLRGCYMPDNSHVAMVKTRRELKELIASEANDMREAHGFGGSKKAIAWMAATCWREAHKKAPAFLPYCLPFGHEPGNYPFGLFVSVASRRDYIDHVSEHE